MIKNSELLNVDHKQEEAILKLKNLFFAGKIFVYPTDTIYGFGGNPFNEEAVKTLNKIKGRGSDKKYILLIGSLEFLFNYVDISSDRKLNFLRKIWPGPVSVIFNLNKKIKKVLKQSKAAFRIPDQNFCIRFLKELQMPVISSSVNRSGKEPINEISLIKEEFGTEVSAIFYTSKQPKQKSSTLIDITGDRPILLREGTVKFESLMEIYNS
ncbi:MAG: hypothetical protein Kow0098_10940 [Ignavibacteriaceae bacterium]